MPLRINWKSKENLGIAIMLFGACGLFQILFIFFAQYLLSVSNYFAIIIIPLAVTPVIYFGSIMIFESFAEVERRENLKSQFRKRRGRFQRLYRFLSIPIVKPLLITYMVFTALFFVSYFIGVLYLSNVYSFIIAENVAAIVCLLVANTIERIYAKVQRL